MSGPGVDFQGRWIVLSGASSDIGARIANTLAEHNAKLILLGRDAAALDRVVAQLPGEGHAGVVIDLGDTDTINATLKSRFSGFAPIYGLCHCAGVVQTRPLASSAPAILQQQMDLNLIAGVELSRLVANRTLGQPGEGSIVFISSVYAHVGAPGQIGYCASKGAVNAAVRAMATELAPRNIKVNAVSPGFIRTDMTTQQARLSGEQIQAIIDKHPLGEGHPDDVSRAVLFLLDPGNRWMTGTDLRVDGGYTAQ